MQVAKGHKQEAVGCDGGASAAADGRAEFRSMFVSLVDPAGLLDMERCGRTAAQMGEAASRSGYRAGIRMASLLADIFADAAGIVDRPVEDGALHHTIVAYREMRAVLYETAVSYRKGGSAEPVGRLEDLRKNIALLRSGADARRAAMMAASPPGSGLPRLDMPYRGMACMDVVRADIEKIRAEDEADGVDPIFPPSPKYLDELFEEFDGTGPSSAEMIEMERGKWPPDGYELVKVGDSK